MTGRLITNKRWPRPCVQVGTEFVCMPTNRRAWRWWNWQQLVQVGAVKSVPIAA